MALLFPAYAGVIPVFRLCPIVARTFPRLRGGDSSNSPSSDIHDNFSPPMRGFYIDNPAQKADNRLILNAERGKVYAVF